MVTHGHELRTTESYKKFAVLSHSAKSIHVRPQKTSMLAEPRSLIWLLLMSMMALLLVHEAERGQVKIVGLRGVFFGKIAAVATSKKKHEICDFCEFYNSLIRLSENKSVVARAAFTEECRRAALLRLM